MRVFGIVLFLAGAIINFTQPLWVDDTPVYPPAVGVVVFGPMCLVGAFALWMAR